mgnify:CR=1 FL=1
MMFGLIIAQQVEISMVILIGINLATAEVDLPLLGLMAFTHMADFTQVIIVVYTERPCQQLEMLDEYFSRKYNNTQYSIYTRGGFKECHF